MLAKGSAHREISSQMTYDPIGEVYDILEKGKVNSDNMVGC